MNFFKKYFRSEKQFELFQLMCLTTMFDCMLVAYRIYYTDFDWSQFASLRGIAGTRSTSYMFLIWNLILAWIPYLISLSLHHFPKKWMAWPALAAWLVFLPNAPYLVTDLLHVGYHPPVPFWYDTLLLFSFAWTGLVLGYLSLMDVHRYLEGNFGKNPAQVAIWAVIGLCAFGVYLGRYQRWNTWDIVTQPYQLFWDIVAVLLHPVNYMGSLGLAVVMAGMLGIGYLTVRTLAGEKRA